MTMPPFQYPDVGERDHNAIVVRVAKEEGERINNLTDVFPTLTISPGVQTPPRLRLQRGLQRIMEAYSGDPYMAEQELSFILSPTYYDDIKAAMVPEPLSMPWAALLPLGYYFKQWHKQFLSDYDAFVKRLET
jgi:hypothetical protein